MKVHPDFHERIRKEQKKFMKKNKLDNLTTTAFTGVLIKKIWNKKNVKK